MTERIGRAHRHVFLERNQKLLDGKLPQDIVGVRAPPFNVDHWRSEFIREVVGHESTLVDHRRRRPDGDAVGGAVFVVAPIRLDRALGTRQQGAVHW